MGDNKKQLAEAYLKLEKELEKAEGVEEQVIQAKLDGMHLAYNLYAIEHWDSLERLLREYKSYLVRD